jgi:hypothetical protein
METVALPSESVTADPVAEAPGEVAMATGIFGIGLPEESTRTATTDKGRRLAG